MERTKDKACVEDLCENNCCSKAVSKIDALDVADL